MILIDSGPLIALNDRRDSNHSRCAGALAGILRQPTATTWPCITEAMHFLGRRGGHSLQSNLWRMIRSGLESTIEISDQESMLAELLMARYQDHPMDLADATLLAVAESRGWRKVLTLDTHFFAFHPPAGIALEILLPSSETP